MAPTSPSTIPLVCSEPVKTTILNRRFIPKGDDVYEYDHQPRRLIARRGKATLGTMTFDWQPDRIGPSAYVMGLHVVPVYRRQGVAKLLIRELTRLCGKLGSITPGVIVSPYAAQLARLHVEAAIEYGTDLGHLRVDVIPEEAAP